MTPVDARTTVTELSLPLGTQMLLPSKIGCCGVEPTVTDIRMVPPLSSFFRKPLSVTQTFAPSKRAPTGRLNPVVTVVTVQGMDAPGVMIETDFVENDWLAVNTRAPSKAIPVGLPPRLLATSVTLPAD